MEEVSLTIDEAKLIKMDDEMLRQRCTSGDEHQYHVDQMKNFLKSDIVWESRKEIIVSPHPRKTTPLVQSCQRDPEAPPLSLINQDLLYLKKGSSGPENSIVTSQRGFFYLFDFPAIIFNDDDIEEQTSRWVNKCVKKFNPYARYGVEHWKNPHAKIFYIRKQKEPGKPKETQEDHSNTVQALNVDSLKVDLVVIQNTCSEKEDSNSKTTSSKSVKESSLNSETKDVHAIKLQNCLKAKEGCMTYFCSLHSHLQLLSKKDLKGTRIKHGFKRAFMSLFGQDNDTFISMMLLNVDKLQKQLDKDEFQEDGSIEAFWTQESNIDTGTTVDADLVATKSSRIESEVQDGSSKSGNDTDADDVDIRPIYDEEPMTEVKCKYVARNTGFGHKNKQYWIFKTLQCNISQELRHMEVDVDISTLVIEQYLALIRDDIRPGVVKPEIGLEVEKRLLAGVINTWDLLEKEFIWQYCSPFKTAKKLEEIHNFKQEIDETLYHAWERYSDLLYRCLQHDLNCQQKVHIFYTGLDISTHRMLDSRGFITLMTPTQALISIQARTTIGKENMKEPVPRDLPPTLSLGHLKKQIGSPYRTRETVCMIENPEEVHKMKDEGDMDDYDVPLHDGMMKPLTPQTVHITPPDDDYVAPATNLILDRQLNEFGEEFSNITKVAEKVNDKELSIVKTYDCETFIQKLLHQVSQSSRETDHGFIGYPFDYRITLGFGSIAGGLDHVNPVIRLPLEHEINKVPGKDDLSNPTLNEVRERREDVYTTLSGFSNEQFSPLGEISLWITMGEASHHRSGQIIFLKALEMEALVDAMDVDSGGLSFKESFIGLFESGRHLVVLVVERTKRVKMTYLDDEKIKKIQNDVPCHDHFEVIDFVLGQEDA
ncbi:retrovirus-related pol polyprotein from transposon TNT 1-94 [Tanacetum coccineum]